VEPHKGEFEVTAHSAQAQLEILEKLVGSLPPLEVQRGRGEGGADGLPGENPIAIIKRAASSLHGTLDELVRMCQTRDTFWRAQVEREKDLRRLWEENMQSLAQEQAQMEEKMNDAIEQRRMTKRALRAMSRAVQQPDKGNECARHLSVSDTDHSKTLKPEDIAPPDEFAKVMSDSDDDEFFDAIGSDTMTLAEDLPPQPVISPAVEKDLSIKEREMQIAAHGHEGPLRDKFEKLDKDNRPKVSLWGILKSMVGRDMTKMVYQLNAPLTPDSTREF